MKHALALSLINMPFAEWYAPSLGLSQLSGVLAEAFGDGVTTEICYLNQDFAEALGPSAYSELASGSEHLTTGLGDWIFRSIAFPEYPDNTTEYFTRYYRGSRWQAFRAEMLAFRERLEDTCQQLISHYRLDQADVVGFTSMFAQTGPSLALARLIKQRNPNVITLMGGANCESPMGRALLSAAESIDYVFSGPALSSLPDFIGRLLQGDIEGARSVQGVLSRHETGHQHHAATERGAERNINCYIAPDYAQFFAALEANAALSDAISRGMAAPILYFETSRGCWWGQQSHCTFCGLNGSALGYRSMDPALALRAINDVLQYYPKCHTFAAADNIIPRSYFSEVLPKLNVPTDVDIFYEVKVPISERDMERMAQAGVRHVQPGIEALSSASLALMGKGTSIFQNIQFLKQCLSKDIKPSWNLLIGFPGESDEVYQRYADIIPQLVHLPPPSGVHIVRFDRFSPYHEDPEKFGLRLKPMDFYELAYPGHLQVLGDLAYFFAEGQGSHTQQAAASWYRQLSQAVDAWKDSWATSDPHLIIQETDRSDYLITDGRAANKVTHRISELEARVLRSLKSPRPLESLVERDGILDRHFAEETIRRFRGLKLVLEEGDLIMSLVTTTRQRG